MTLVEFEAACKAKGLELPSVKMESSNLYQAVMQFRRTPMPVQRYWAGDGSTKDRVAWFSYPDDLQALRMGVEKVSVICKAIGDWNEYRGRLARQEDAKQ